VLPYYIGHANSIDGLHAVYWQLNCNKPLTATPVLYNPYTGQSFSRLPWLVRTRSGTCYGLNK